MSGYIKERVTDNDMWYIFLDEVQMCKGFESVLYGKVARKRLEVDFVCNRGNQRYYIQSVFSIPDSSKMQQEQKSLVHIGDSFKKIIVAKDRIKLLRNEEGIVGMGIVDVPTDEEMRVKAGEDRNS